jgi:hypothetical protein
VYVVWVQRWASDARTEADGAGMVDPRVTHLWDAGKVIGQSFLERFGVDFGGLDYNFFLLSVPMRSGTRRHRGRRVRARRWWVSGSGWPATSHPCWIEPVTAVVCGQRGCPVGGPEHLDRAWLWADVPPDLP